MQKNEKCFNFVLMEYFKQDKFGKVFGNVCFYKYFVQEFCVYEILSYYIMIIEKLRNFIKLFVLFIKLYRVVILFIIGCWIKIVLGQVGIDIGKFFGYSIRCVLISKVFLFVFIDVILVIVGWIEEFIFWKFYNKLVVVINQMSLVVFNQNWFCIIIFVLLKCLDFFQFLWVFVILCLLC